jgi:hypothetical protein
MKGEAHEQKEDCEAGVARTGQRPRHGWCRYAQPDTKGRTRSGVYRGGKTAAICVQDSMSVVDKRLSTARRRMHGSKHCALCAGL